MRKVSDLDLLPSQGALNYLDRHSIQPANAHFLRHVIHSAKIARHELAQRGTPLARLEHRKTSSRKPDRSQSGEQYVLYGRSQARQRQVKSCLGQSNQPASPLSVHPALFVLTQYRSDAALPAQPVPGHRLIGCGPDRFCPQIPEIQSLVPAKGRSELQQSTGSSRTSALQHDSLIVVLRIVRKFDRFARSVSLLYVYCMPRASALHVH